MVFVIFLEAKEKSHERIGMNTTAGPFQNTVKLFLIGLIIS